MVVFGIPLEVLLAVSSAVFAAAMVVVAVRPQERSEDRLGEERFAPSAGRRSSTTRQQMVVAAGLAAVIIGAMTAAAGDVLGLIG